MDIPEQPPSTGHPRVDGVVASLEQLDTVPVDEHVAIFEKAHAELRQALDEDPGDAPTQDPAEGQLAEDEATGFEG